MGKSGNRIIDCGMRGILMSIFTDFIAFKSSLFKCNRNDLRVQKEV